MAIPAAHRRKASPTFFIARTSRPISFAAVVRMMLTMSQTNLGSALGLTFQQVQKYEKGTNRIGASRLQHISHILQVPVAFFFEGAPSVPGTPQATETAPSPAYVTDFLAMSNGLAFIKAFMRIKNAKLKRRIVELVEEIAVDHDH